MKPIVITGGGVSGLCLGVILRKRGVPVTVKEAGIYPRHHVCGEFINGRGLETLKRTELEGLLEKAGAVKAYTASFHTHDKSSRAVRLRMPALCISRYSLDTIMAEEFRRLGGGLLVRERCRDEELHEGWVRASGRKISAGEAADWKWLGLKAHAKGAKTETDMELHLVPGGYVGLCVLPGGEVNVCGLFRYMGQAPKVRLGWKGWLAGCGGSALHDRLKRAEWLEDTFCSVAGFHPASSVPHTNTEECSVGDSVGMIPPFTGNGMSMALETAETAAPFVEAFSRGEAGWNETCAMVSRKLHGLLWKRFALSSAIHRLMFSSDLVKRVLVSTCEIEPVWRVFYEGTRC